MLIRLCDIRRCAVYLILTFSMCGTAFAANDDGASDLGVDYAFMFLMILSPDFAAANYTIENDDGSDVDINIARLPFHIDLLETLTEKLQLEIAFAYQKTEELIEFASFPGENIDAQWNTYGGGLGLLYQHKLSDHLHFTPSLRAGFASMENDATYNGTFLNLIKDQFDGTLLNWKTNASILNLGLGLSYDWTLGNRQSSIKADAYHVVVDSFNESSPAVKFTEQANMLAIKADMIFPTNGYIADNRLDLVLLLGTNTFFGENRDTLGYTTSYQVGIGSELPLHWSNKERGHMRLSGQVLWAGNMRGWLLTVGYNPD